MDIKLKNNHKISKIGILIAIVAILMITTANLFLFPEIGRYAEEEYQKRIENSEEELHEELFRDLLRIAVKLSFQVSEQSYDDIVEYAVEGWAENAELYGDRIDYFVRSEYDEKTNTENPLSELLPEKKTKNEKTKEMQEYYECYIALSYDEKGKVSIEEIWYREKREDEILKILLRYGTDENFQEWQESYIRENQAEMYDLGIVDETTDKKIKQFVPRNTQVVFAIPEEEAYLLLHEEAGGNRYWVHMHCYEVSGDGLLYITSLAVLTILMLLLTANKSWKECIKGRRRRHWYLMECAFIGIMVCIACYESFAELNADYISELGMENPYDLFYGGTIEQITYMLYAGMCIALLYGMWYVSILLIRPVLTLGVREYLKSYSLAYFVISKGVTWCRKRINKIKTELSQLDFSDKTIRMLRKIIVINFVVLSVISCFWMFGIFLLIIYSVILFFFLKKKYKKVQHDYEVLVQATSRIAQGELNCEEEEEWGIFEPLKEEFAQIRSGFSAAVEEEVKSQRMKTELITNVSHDLKTPLTAITTYVELLKDKKITPKQQASYIEILEKKTARLKELVEDLFEVSKATSNTIKLELMEVDVVKLLKQVCVEHEEKFSERGLLIKWNLHQDNITCMLDNQKTWRIFDNLFTNIEKYAMENSRVYIEVREEDGAEIILKNMSAQEITINGEEITERFVRGDVSRTTEGAGLGLAIAKSFTEAQGGRFEVKVDGDLFKVVIQWK